MPKRGEVRVEWRDFRQNLKQQLETPLDSTRRLPKALCAQETEMKRKRYSTASFIAASSGSLCAPSNVGSELVSKCQLCNAFILLLFARIRANYII